MSPDRQIWEFVICKLNLRHCLNASSPSNCWHVSRSILFPRFLLYVPCSRTRSECGKGIWLRYSAVMATCVRGFTGGPTYITRRGVVLSGTQCAVANQILYVVHVFSTVQLGDHYVGLVVRGWELQFSIDGDFVISGKSHRQVALHPAKVNTLKWTCQHRIKNICFVITIIIPLNANNFYLPVHANRNEFEM